MLQLCPLIIITVKSEGFHVTALSTCHSYSKIRRFSCYNFNNYHSSSEIGSLSCYNFVHSSYLQWNQKTFMLQLCRLIVVTVKSEGFRVTTFSTYHSYSEIRRLSCFNFDVLIISQNICTIWEAFNFLIFQTFE